MIIRLLILIGILLVISLILNVELMIGIRTNGKWFGLVTHELLDQHYPSDEVFHNGIVEYSTCKYCGKRIVKRIKGH